MQATKPLGLPSGLLPIIGSGKAVDWYPPTVWSLSELSEQIVQLRCVCVNDRVDGSRSHVIQSYSSRLSIKTQSSVRQLIDHSSDYARSWKIVVRKHN